MNKSIITSIIGLIALFSLGVVVNTDNETIFEQNVLSNLSQEDTVDYTQENHEIAAKLTKSECKTNMWYHWSEKEIPTGENIIGQAEVMTSRNPQGDSVEIQLYIHDKLTAPENIKHTAWHECAHAKTYAIDSEKTPELYNRAQAAFANCGHPAEECLADAMTEIKVPNTTSHYYQNEFTHEQLEIAKEVWEATGKIKENNKIKHTPWQMIG